MSGIVAIIIIAVLFLAISIGVAYGASRGSFRVVSNALQSTNRSGSRLLNTVLVVVYIGVGIAVPLVFIIGNRDNSNAQVGGVKLTAAMQAGRELFSDHCAVCHTLAANNAVGKVGPNLDSAPAVRGHRPAHDRQRLPAAANQRQQHVPGLRHHAGGHRPGPTGPGHRRVRGARRRPRLIAGQESALPVSPKGSQIWPVRRPRKPKSC